MMSMTRLMSSRLMIGPCTLVWHWCGTDQRIGDPGAACLDATAHRQHGVVARRRAISASIFEPPLQLSVLFVGERGIEMLDRYIGRGDQHRLGMSERIEAVFSVVVAHPG